MSEAAAEAKASWLPGIEEELGWGVNIFKGYVQSKSNNSKCDRLIDATAAGEMETVKYHDIEYRKPKGVVQDKGHGFVGQARVFSSKAKVSSIGRNQLM